MFSVEDSLPMWGWSLFFIAMLVCSVINLFSGDLGMSIGCSAYSLLILHLMDHKKRTKKLTGRRNNER